MHDAERTTEDLLDEQDECIARACEIARELDLRHEQETTTTQLKDSQHD